MKQINVKQILYKHPFKKTLVHAGESICYNIPSIIGHAHLEEIDYQVPEPIVENQQVKLGFWLDDLDKFQMPPRRIYKYIKGKTKTFQLPIPKHFLSFLKFNGVKQTKVGFKIIVDENTNNRLIVLENE